MRIFAYLMDMFKYFLKWKLFNYVRYLFLVNLIFNLMVSIETSWWNILTMKIYTTIGYIVSLIL